MSLESVLHTANEGLVIIQYKCLVPIYVFPEMKMCSIVISETGQFLHSRICERFTYTQDRSAYFAATKYVDRYWEYINRSQTHESRNWDCGRSIPFLGIQTWYLFFSAPLCWLK
jgi:hypothetical protein